MGAVTSKRHEMGAEEEAWIFPRLRRRVTGTLGQHSKGKGSPDAVGWQDL